MADYLATTPSQLGLILRGFRQQRSLTQDEVAKALSLPQKAISSVENHPEHVSLTRIFELLSALDVELVLRDKGEGAVPRTEW